MLSTLACSRGIDDELQEAFGMALLSCLECYLHLFECVAVGLSRLLVAAYVMPYNVLAFVISVLIIYLFASIPVPKRQKDEEEVPLNVA